MILGYFEVSLFTGGRGKEKMCNPEIILFPSHVLALVQCGSLMLYGAPSLILIGLTHSSHWKMHVQLCFFTPGC